MTKRKKGKVDPNQAATLTLGSLEQPVVTAYHLGIILWRLYLAGQYQGQDLKTPDDTRKAELFIRSINRLQQIGIIRARKDFPKETVFNILGKEHDSPEEIVCAVDPFAYVSHLSAMAYHGLTDRMPWTVFVSSPAPQKWREFARDRMSKDLGETMTAYIQDGWPKLVRIEISKINGRPVNRYASIHQGAFKTIKDRPLRVSTIGRTFLDMLRRPDLCGGIHHILDIFEEFGGRYLGLIADEIDRHGKNIDKVRAGYILEEHCGLQSERLEAWLQYARRGGSQKLDPSGEYCETYSERWCLSLNIG